MTNLQSRATNASAVPPIERRTTARADMCVDVGFLCDACFYAGLSADISEGGVFVSTHVLLPLGTELTLTFALPEGHEVTTAGVVRWLSDPQAQQDAGTPGMGIQFRALRSTDLSVIREFVLRREPIFIEA